MRIQEWNKEEKQREYKRENRKCADERIKEKKSKRILEKMI